MDKDIEQVRARAETLLNSLIEWFNTAFLSISSTYQIGAVVCALFGAILVHQKFRRVLEALANRIPDAGFLRRVLRTLSSISLAVVWVLGLWISATILQNYGQPFAFVRLVASLANAWIVIRVVTILIPSVYWSAVFAWCAWSVAALNAVGLLKPFIAILEDTAFSLGDVRVSLWTVVKGVIVTVLLVWLAYIVSGLVQRRLERARSFNTSMRVLIGKLIRIAMIVIAVVVGLTAVGIDLTAFAIFSGAIGVGVGLGMQRTVSNLFAGFSLLADRSLKPGDVIEIETASGPTYGTVKTMTTRYVAVLTRDGTETLIPNEILISSPVTNWSYSNKQVRRRISIGVAYNTDLDLAIQLCLQAAKEAPRVLSTPAPVCLLKGFGDSSVDLELRVWLNDPEDGVSNAASDIYLRIWRLFKANNIEIPYPQQDLHLRSAIPLRIESALTS